MSEYDTSPWLVKDVSIQISICGSCLPSPFITSCFKSDRNTQIVYTAIVGSLMILSFLEWFLWLAAFLYCLVKVFQKAEHWSTRVLAVLVAIVFSALRYDTIQCCIVFTHYSPDSSSFLSWSSLYHCRATLHSTSHFNLLQYFNGSGFGHLPVSLRSHGYFASINW